MLYSYHLTLTIYCGCDPYNATGAGEGLVWAWWGYPEAAVVRALVGLVSLASQAPRFNLRIYYSPTFLLSSQLSLDLRTPKNPQKTPPKVFRS